MCVITIPLNPSYEISLSRKKESKMCFSFAECYTFKKLLLSTYTQKTKFPCDAFSPCIVGWWINKFGVRVNRVYVLRFSFFCKGPQGPWLKTFTHQILQCTIITALCLCCEHTRAQREATLTPRRSACREAA